MKKLTIVLLLLFPMIVQADGRRAARLFTAGQQAYEKGDYLTAIRAFEQSQRIQPHPSAVFAMAQAYRRQYELDRDLPKLSKAVELYRQFIKAAPRSPWAKTAQAELVQLLAIVARQPASKAAATLPKTTQLMISSETPGARAFIDGEPKGGEAVPAIRVVGPGPHRVEVKAPGHLPAVKTVQAVKDRLVVAMLDLEPAPGKLRVAANTDGATVYLDGKAMGRTPFEINAVTPGKHTVAVVDRGKKLWSSKIDVTSGQTLSAVANLSWSTQRKLAVGSGAASIAVGLAGLVTGLLALQKDTAIDSMARTTNDERRSWIDAVSSRDGLATSSTILFSVAGAALAACAAMYWFDSPEAPVAHTPAKTAASSWSVQW